MARLPTLLVLVLLALPSAGCVGEDEGYDSDASYQSAVRPLLICQQGLGDRSAGWDKGLFDFCESIESEGFHLVWDGSYPAFGALDTFGAYHALFDTLDTNGDGVVDSGDQRFAIHLVGFSWGGMEMAYLADILRRDGRVKGARDRVEAMVLFDAYQPFTTRVPIAENVALAWLYRQSDTTSNDCSHDVSLGIGFNGHHPIVRSADTKCGHYDLDAFFGDVTHCGMVNTAAEAAFVNLTKKKSYAPWHGKIQGCKLQ